MIQAIQEFGSAGGLTRNGMEAMIGPGHRDEKTIPFMFPDFSWTAKRILQLALTAYRAGRRSRPGRIAMLEIARSMPNLRPAELLAVSVALDHGVNGLREVKSSVGLLKLK
jgi:hypothetical protein